MNKTAALVLAAGKGTRMHSQRPKVLQTILGEPMLACVLHALAPIFNEEIWIVAGHGAELVREAFPERRFILQNEQLGTGHAVMVAMETLKRENVEYVAVINGDAPLLSSETLQRFLRKAEGADMAFATIVLPDAGTYGRVVRNPGLAIVEAKDFDAAIHGPDRGEVNAGVYLLRMACAEKLLPQIKNANKSGEYYLTDLAALAFAENMDVRAVECGSDACLLGVNSPAELANAENILAMRVAERLMESGVMVHGPQFLRASPLAQIEPGAEITAPCEIYGRTIIRRGACVASHCVIRDSVISENATVRSFSHLDGAVVGKGAVVGPYTRLRPGAELEEDAHAGNFVELKKARLGKAAKANHLTYLGDAEIGDGANIGAGTITCNYDGKNKFKTAIGKRAFIGSNTALVAPVCVGDDVLVGAGSVITKNVPDGEMAIARARQANMQRRR